MQRIFPQELLYWEEEPTEQLALKARGAWFQESHKTGERRNLKGTQNLTCSGTQGKSTNLIGAWARPTCWSWRVFGVGWGGATVAPLGT